MIRKRSLYALFGAAMLSSALFFTACEEDTPVTTDTAPAAPTGLMALSLNDSTVRVKWTASTSESNSNFKDYELTASGANGAGDLTFTPAAKGETTVNLTGLKKGVKYTVSVKARSTTLSSAAATVECAGATRMTGKRAYETAASQGSGLSLANGENLTISSGGQWDLCLDTRVVNGVDNVAFGAPGASTYTDNNGKFNNGQQAKATVIFSTGTTPNFTPATFDADNMDDIFDTQAIGTGKTGVQIMVENLETKTKGVVFYGKTAEGNYFKAIIKAGTGGKILQGSAGTRYVEVDYSYQSAANVPHALLQRMFVANNPTIVKMHTATTK